MMDKYQKESEIEQVEAPITAVAISSADTTSAAPAIAASSAQSVSSAPMTLAPVSTSSTTTVPSSTTTTLKPTTTTTTLKPTTTTVAKTTTTTVAAMAPAAANPVEVIVEALNNIEVKFTLDNGSVQTLALAADQVHTFRGKSTVQLDVSDGGAINVIVNGRDRGVPGSIGKSLKLSYP
jgi:cytoskeleton protein RodZ